MGRSLNSTSSSGLEIHAGSSDARDYPNTIYDKFTVPWIGKETKYQIGPAPLYVEEVKEPWDLWMESAYMQSSLGGVFHQTLIKNGLERLFSIRSNKRTPLCDILTMPVDARQLSTYWCTKRTLKTSSPMTIDGQELIVLDVFQQQEKRASDPFLGLARTFFKAHGGQLNDEHPNGLAISDKHEVHIWHEIAANRTLENILVSSKELFKEKYLVHATTLEETIVLLRVKYWWNMYLDGDEPWAEQVIDHMISIASDKPRNLTILGSGEKVAALKTRGEELMHDKVA